MISLNTFTGINNVADPLAIGVKGLVVADNVDIGPEGRRVSRRSGYSLALAASAPHSLFSCSQGAYFIIGSQLHYVTSLTESAGSFTVTSEILKTFPAVLNNVSFCEVAGRVFFSDGIFTGIVQNNKARSWGIPPPTFIPPSVVESNSGGIVNGLRQGYYFVAVTYQRSDGQESGSSRPLAFYINANDSGLDLSNIPVSIDPDVVSKDIYLSTTDGDVLYWMDNIPNATTTWSYDGASLGTGRMLSTEFKREAPAGQIAGFHKGRMYVADKDLLYYSDARNYEMFDERQYLQMTSVITMFAPVDDGFFLGTETDVMFVSGSDPSEFSKNSLNAGGPVRGTSQKVDATQFGIDGVHGEGYLWAADTGVYFGGNGSIVVNLTADKYLPARSNMGGSMIRKQNGNVQYIVSLQDPNTALYRRDTGVTETERNFF